MGRCSRMLQCRTSRAQQAASPFGCTRYLQRPVARSAETTEAAFIRSIQAPRFVRAGRAARRRAATSSRDRAERIAAGNSGGPTMVASTSTATVMPTPVSRVVTRLATAM